MFHEKNKSLFSSAVDSVVSAISQYTVNPGKDLTRCKKLPPDKLITFLVPEGSSSTKNELLDFFGMDVQAPIASAFNQQRAKLKPEALEAVSKQFNYLNAFYDLEKYTNTDAVIQPVHHKDEFRAFCDMVDRYESASGRMGIFVGDRGYCSYSLQRIDRKI